MKNNIGDTLINTAVIFGTLAGLTYLGISIMDENNDPKILIPKVEIMINKEGQQIGICEADKYKIIKVPKKNK